uniref:F-box/kelch-repeat protein At3g06240-like isoform X2 n=1 Tax=Erigeron canadensis TaxID=72917 RepID=UPI001CB92733|nr:F-box/kelch-repeat protein At3g06240-like isoform X2 [Erigeron canadensis]
MTQFLPPEIIAQIIIKLDVRDLIRYKSVSKSWLSLITSPDFVKGHLECSRRHDHDNIGNRRIVMSSFPGSELSHISETSGIYFDRNINHLLGSSNGLVCIFLTHNNFLVVNAETREVKKLKKPQFPFLGACMYGFGYDSSKDDYKVVVGIQKDKGRMCFYMLTLKSNTWEVIGDVDYTCISRVGVLYNGALHWVAYHGAPQNKQQVILSLDLSENEFKEISQPDDERYKLEVGSHWRMRLGIFDDCLCAFYHGMLPCSIWVMSEYNVKQSWQRLSEPNIHTEIVHQLKQLKRYIPNSRSLCHKIWLSQGTRYVGTPLYVPSLVSPHGCRKLKRKREATRSIKSGKVSKDTISG